MIVFPPSCCGEAFVPHPRDHVLSQFLIQDRLTGRHDFDALRNGVSRSGLQEIPLERRQGSLPAEDPYHHEP